MKKRIALLRANPKDASLERLLTSLSGHYRIDCYLWDRQGDFVPPAGHKDVRFMLCPLRAGFYDMKTFLKLILFEIWLLRKLLFAEFDAVHAIDLDTGLAGFLMARLRSKKFIYHCLDPYYAVLPEGWPRILGILAKYVENAIISHADVFIITDMLRLRQHSGAKPREIIEIANTPFLSAVGDRNDELGGFLIGYIGSLVEGRNLDTLIQTAGELRDHGIALVIGGFGPLEERVKNLAKQYENVEYTGWVPYEQVLEIERRFQVFAYVTDCRNEGQKWVSPNKLFESMAFAKPIIVGEGTLAGERVNAMRNGVVVAYGNRPELRRAILLLRDNPQLRRQMGENGRQEYETKWTPAIMEKRLLDVYTRTV